jgi:hypothetical protein
MSKKEEISLICIEDIVDLFTKVAQFKKGITYKAFLDPLHIVYIYNESGALFQKYNLMNTYEHDEYTKHFEIPWRHRDNKINNILEEHGN